MVQHYYQYFEQIIHRSYSKILSQDLTSITHYILSSQIAILFSSIRFLPAEGVCEDSARSERDSELEALCEAVGCERVGYGGH